MRGATAPRFWWRPPGLGSRLLQPAAALYGAVAGRRLRSGASAFADAPVLCVGNPTLGGAGKTPSALALGRAALGSGLSPGFLSRGHGGSAAGPLRVDPARHDARFVGDEPLLLAALAPTVVSRDRVAGAAMLTRDGDCDFIIMDDGFQSARLAYDLALLVVDGGRGLGNGAVFPAGPLRAPLGVQMRHADALLVVGEGAGVRETEAGATRFGLPLHRGRLAPRNAAELVGAPLLAFAGIADPEKFYRSLREIGADARATRDFPDHHPFAPSDIAELEATASREGLTPVTTAKDAVRLQAAGEAGRGLLARSLVLHVDLVFEPDGLAGELVAATVEAFRGRRPL